MNVQGIDTKKKTMGISHTIKYISCKAKRGVFDLIKAIAGLISVRARVTVWVDDLIWVDPLLCKQRISISVEWTESLSVMFINQSVMIVTSEVIRPIKYFKRSIVRSNSFFQCSLAGASNTNSGLIGLMPIASVLWWHCVQILSKNCVPFYCVIALHFNICWTGGCHSHRRGCNFFHGDASQDVRFGASDCRCGP